MNISLVNLFLASFGLYIVFKFVFFPFAKHIAEKDKSPSSLRKYVIRNIVDFGGLFFLLTTLSSGISWLIVKIVNLKGGATLNEVKDALESVRKLESIISTLSNEWAITTTVLLAVGLIILAYKSTKASFNEKLNIALSKEINRLRTQLDEGQWEDLPPTEEMKKVYGLIDQYDKTIEEIQGLKETEENLSELINLHEVKSRLVAYIEQLDIQRRLKIEIEEESYLLPTSIKNRVLLFFVSEGLMNTFKKSSAVLFASGILLLIPSVLSVGAIAIENGIKTKIASLDSELEHLELEFQGQKVNDEFKSILTAKRDNIHTAAKDPFTDEDEQILNELSRVFENNFIEARILGQATAHLARASRITSYTVRGAILDQFRTADNSVRVHNSASIPELVDDAVALEKKAILHNEPVTELGKRFKRDLKAIAVREKKLWSHYKTLVVEATRSFQIPASVRSMKGMMISNVIGHLAQGIEVPGTTGKMIGTLGSLPSNIAEQFYITESQRYMTVLAHSEHLNQAIEKLGQIESNAMLSRHLEKVKALTHKIPEEGRLTKVLTENPPSLSRTVEPHVQLAKAEATVRSIATANNTLRTETFADALSSFSDHFPGYQGEDLKTSRGRTVASSAPHSRSGKYASAKSSFTRARSYTRLRGFSRIGGVLIGKMPIGEESLDITEIDWWSNGSKLSIALAFRNGKRIKVGDFNPAIVHLALGYAADGRVTTVTMITAEPLYDLKILLHPALVDTGLGCRAIKLDQIADVTTSANAELKNLRELENSRIRGAKILYSYAWAVRVKTITTSNIELAAIMSSNQDFNENISRYVSYSEDIISQYSRDVDQLLKNRKYNLDFISNKKDFYDKNLVQIIKTCENTTSFRSCIAANISISSSTSYPTWLYSPPQTTEWSGVREREYQLDQELQFLRLDQHDDLWPFRFMVQTVFTSTPDFSKNQDDYSDSDPWEFQAVNKLLMKTISRNITYKPEIASLLKDMREMAILQRMFRLAFEGRFGGDFPVVKLATLAQQTKGDVSGHPRTLRWLPKPGVLEQVADQEIFLGRDREKVQQVLALQQRLRSELGIHKDEEQYRKSKECPKP